MRTTDRDFATFRDAASHWQQRLGLTSWKLYFRHAELQDEFADTAYRTHGRVATLTLSTVWNDLRPLTDAELFRLAKHELLHLLLAEVNVLARDRFASEADIERAEHAVIVTLENVLPNA